MGRRAVPPDRPTHGRGPGARAADGGGGGPRGRGHRRGGPRERSLDGLLPVVARIAGGLGELRDHRGRRHCGDGVRRPRPSRRAAPLLAARRELRAAAGDGRARGAVRRGPGRRHHARGAGRHAAAGCLGADRRFVGLGDRIARRLDRRHAGADRGRPPAGARSARAPRLHARRGGPLRRDGHRARPAGARPHGAPGPDLRPHPGSGAGLDRSARSARARGGLDPARRHRHGGQPADARRVPLEPADDELRHDPGRRLPHLQHRQRLDRAPARADRRGARGGSVADDGAGGLRVRGGRLRHSRRRGRPRPREAARDRGRRCGRADGQLALREQHARGGRVSALDSRGRGRRRGRRVGAVRVVAGARGGRRDADRGDGRSGARLQRAHHQSPLHCRGGRAGAAGNGFLPDTASRPDSRRGLSGPGLPGGRHRDGGAAGVDTRPRRGRPMAGGSVRSRRGRRGARSCRIARPHFGDRRRDGGRHRPDRRHGNDGRQLQGDGRHLGGASAAGGFLRESGRRRRPGCVVHHGGGGRGTAGGGSRRAGRRPLPYLCDPLPGDAGHPRSRRRGALRPALGHPLP